MKIIMSGGGTGGHIYPALTLLRTIQSKMPEAEFLYVGTEHGLEADIIPKENIPFRALDLAGGFERHFTLENFKRAANAILSIKKAGAIVKEFNPNVVVGTGGYVCGPILLAASLDHVPTLIQEQNVVAGITNKILSKFVTKIAVGSERALKKFPADKTTYTGNPIRKAVLEGTRAEGLKTYNFVDDKPVVLISGGSRGARSINRAMIDVLAHASKDDSIQYLHVTGRGEYDDVITRLKDAGVDLSSIDHIRVEPYLYDMPRAMAMADLAVFRAGATGLAELTARGVPSILIPYPFAAENHQEFNARELVDAGAARMILNKDLTSTGLERLIKELLSDREKLQSMAAASKKLGQPQAADVIADMIIDLSKERSGS